MFPFYYLSLQEFNTTSIQIFVHKNRKDEMSKVKKHMELEQDFEKKIISNDYNINLDFLKKLLLEGYKSIPFITKSKKKKIKKKKNKKLFKL